MVFGPILESSSLPLSIPRALNGSEVKGSWVGWRRVCVAKSLLGGDVVFNDILIYSRVLYVMRWSMLEKVPGVTTLWGRSSLEAKL
jgi:hypothetical protein